METENNVCMTCAGSGEMANEYGPADCRDCAGLGQLPSASVLRERRLRELELIHSGASEAAADVRFLVQEVRTAQHVMLQIMAAAMERPEGDELGAKIRFLANHFLELYPVSARD